MPQIRPVTDLKNIDEISELCHEKKEPIFFTKEGYGDLVLMSIEAYEQMTEKTAVDEAIEEAEKEVGNGSQLLDARQTLTSLRRRHFG